MTIHLKPHLEAVLKAQVDAGNFSDVEEALEAAILALEDAGDDLHDDDIAWIKPLIDEAEAEIAEKGTLSEDEVRDHFEKRRANR